MTMREFNQPAKTRDSNRYMLARIEVHTGYVLFVLLLLLHFGAFSANAQRQQEQIVFVAQSEDREQIHLSNGKGGQVKKLTNQELSFRVAIPSLSFDGEQVAYVWRFGGRGQWQCEIFVMDIRSGEQHQVTFSPSEDLHPSWAPDGGRIAFASNKGGVFNLYTIDADGQNRTRMTNSTGDDVQPDWSPDGRKIAFASDQASAYYQIYWMDVKTGHQQQLTQKVFKNRYPRWSPDGTQIAFRSAVIDRGSSIGIRQIWQVSADGTGLKSIIKDGEHNDDPAFSPNIKQIAFSSSRDGNTDIYIFDRDSMETLRLTRDPSLDYQPNWSPDGKHLVFVSDRTGNADIHKINADGGGIVNLTQSETSEFMPAWSPEGEMISFVRAVGVNGEIHVMDSDGNRQMLLDNTPVSDTWPAWSPQGDKIAFLNKPEQDTKAYRIYTIDTDGQNKQLLFETEASEIKSINWSADGKRMLFVYYDGLIQEIRIFDMITREVSSIDLRVGGLDSADWAPIGRTIVFSAFSVDLLFTLSHGIFVLDAAGDHTQEPRPLWDTFIPNPRHGEGRFSWSPGGQSILYNRGSGNLYITGLNGGGVTLFLRNANSPDWKMPVSRERVTAENKLHTTWGEVKK